MNTPQIRRPADPAGAPQAADASDEQAHRAGLYSILAALLRDSPDDSMLAFLRALEEPLDTPGAELATALDMLSLAARHSETHALRSEFHALFIGLGRGELVPYGSWYQTGFLMEKPLGLLRQDLAVLGFERTEDTCEPEDHVAALCEVMSLMIGDGVSLAQQRHFFTTHLGNWGGDFFADLGEARSAVFYRSVARLGSAFIRLEARYLSLLD